MTTEISRAEDIIRQVLADNFGSFVAKSTLEDKLYGVGHKPRTNTIEVFIGRLRRKGFTIETKKGTGYRLVSLMRDLTTETEARFV